MSREWVWFFYHVGIGSSVFFLFTGLGYLLGQAIKNVIKTPAYFFTEETEIDYLLVGVFSIFLFIFVILFFALIGQALLPMPAVPEVIP